METLLPSEIARLVLGYLEDQKCNEAARIFLETSPHLQECRTVISNGRRFSTKVNGMTLMDIVEKLSAINSMIQERLAKVSDCEQLKHCGDLLEQLKFLVEETRGQRFVVNINVPSQTNSQISNGSPIISSSMRKRRHSNSDRERLKRTKLLSNTSPQSESVSSQVIGCEVTEATPLDSLPGHADSPKSSEQTLNVKRKIQDNTVEEHQSLYNSKTCSVADSNCTTNTNDKISQVDVGDNKSVKDIEVNVVTNNPRKEDEVTNLPSFEKCTAATSTEELLSFSCAEVQTTPYYTPESETETNDEPIENLSLLTKELLNRTELQERIAENINKAILPVDTSLRDESLHDSIGGEQNTSIMVELTNAIKSIVEATETDPVFEKFLDEIIGPHTETDTSPDEETDTKQQSKVIDESRERQTEDVSNNVGSPEVTMLDVRSSNETDAADLPLKRRLRSSSRQQTARIEDEMDKQREHEKEQSALEDQNAAAVLSIINANIINSKSTSDNKKIIDNTREIICLDDESEKKLPTFIPNVSKSEQILKPITIDDQKNDNETATTNTYTDLKVRKSMMRRPRPSKLKRESEAINKEYVNESEVITMPTLVMCSKEQISDILTTNIPYASNHSIASTKNSRFIPIAPKDSGKINKETVETLYLKTVNVPQKIIPVTVAKTTKSLPTQITVQTIPTKGKKISTIKPAQIITPLQTVSNLTVNVVEPDSKKMVGDESITLYGNENSTKTLLEGSSIPTINVEENISLSGTGLSPYLKFSCNKNHQNQSLSDIDVVPIGEDKKIPTQSKVSTVNEQSSSIYKTTDCDIISKRTPRSLLKSRSKNHRLSLSTPRRRSNHIRALDFNTPAKMVTARRTSAEPETTSFSSRSEKQLKSVCKSSLFKSPPFSNAVISMRKIKSPSLKLCRPCKNPVPNLVEVSTKHNEENCTDDVSVLKPAQVSECIDKNQSKPVKVMKDTWDADLRKALQINQQNEYPPSKSTKAGRKKSTRSKSNASAKKDKCNSQVARNKSKRVLSKDIVDTKDESSQEQVSSTIVEEEKCKSETSDVEKATSKPLNQIERKDPDNAKKETTNVQDTSDVSYKCSTSGTQKNDNDDTLTKNIASASNNNTVPETGNVKKYAQLKTIKINLSRCNIEKKVDVETNVSTTDMLQSSEFPKSSVDIAQHILQIPHIIDLETPRKFDIISGVPPTPRLLSPSSNSTPLIKISEDSSRMRSFINTPEFPTTPCITITPKSNEDTTRDSIKKDNFNSCSPYYKPTSEQHETSNKTSKLKAGNNVQKSPIISSSMQQSASHGIVSSTNMYQTSVPTKFEITQFEVIKENLPKEEAVKELKISSNSGDSTCVAKLKTDCIDNVVTEQQVKNNEDEDTKKYCTITNSEKLSLNNEDTSDSDSSTSSDSSSSSSSSSTSSSSSSASTVSSKTSNSSAEYLVNKKRSSIKIYTDSSNDSEPKDTVVQGASNDVTNSHNNSPKLKIKAAAVNISQDTEKVVGTSIKSESSPLKVFSIVKSEEELKSTTKETPAKDDTLLNEADISETPSSSKAGVESLTNLSSKISAFIGSDEQKLAEPTSSLEVEKTTELKKLKEKPKIVNVERLRSRVVTSRKTAIPKYSCFGQNEQKYAPTTKKLAAQMEAKRQRMIAKFREIPKTNVSRGTAQSKNVLKTRGNLKKNTTPYQHPPKDDDCTSTRKRRVPCNNSKKKEIKDETKSNNNLKAADLNAEDCRVNVADVKPVDSKVTTSEEISSSAKYVNTKTSIKESTESTMKTAGLEIRSGQREASETARPERKTSTSSFEKKKKTATKSNREDSRTKLSAMDIEEEKSNGGSKRPAKETIVDKTNPENVSVAVKEDQSCQEEVTTRVRDSASPNGKTQSTFKSKVDQVKRDLFIDEKNECKIGNIAKASRDQSTDKMNDQTCNSSAIHPDDANPNDPKDLSSVLQCLQLVPASKIDQIEEEQATDMNRHEFNTSALNSVEYHFIYDDDTPVKKRRRRYSSHELEFQINIILNDQNPEECVKIMTTTDYEEIFNITPKSRKKFIGKKSPIKNEVGGEALAKSNSISLLKNITAKPLATSSPVDKIIVPKTRKSVVKNVTENEETKEVQLDNKKKLKSDKSQETEKDNPTTKARKRKISESKEAKQIEKKPHISNPQALLSNLDLDRFLTSVHGPA